MTGCTVVTRRRAGLQESSTGRREHDGMDTRMVVWWRRRAHRRRRRILGRTRSRFTAPTLRDINWDTPHAYDIRVPSTAGLRPSACGGRTQRRPDQLAAFRRVHLPPKQIEYGRGETAVRSGDPALSRASATPRRGVGKSVAFRRAGASLTLTRLERGDRLDSASPRSDRRGATYKSLACTDTTTETNPVRSDGQGESPWLQGYSGGGGRDCIGRLRGRRFSSPYGRSTPGTLGELQR